MGAGEDWRKRREELGKTLEESSAELRISRKYLRGIEEGNYSRWPAKVFSSGFIRAYANMLSVDPEPVLSEYYHFLESQATEESPLQARPEWLERERRRGSRRATYWIATGAVLIVGVLLAWYGRHTAPPVPPAPEVHETAPAPVPAVQAPSENAVLPAVAAAGEGDEPAAPSAVAEPETGTTARDGGEVTAPYQMFLEASELTWIMYSRDDSEPVDVMLYPGDRLSIQARNRMYVKIGNAGGVVGTLNGKPMPPFGEKRQVREITLGE